jgi:hypothetical protein
VKCIIGAWLPFALSKYNNKHGAEGMKSTSTQDLVRMYRDEKKSITGDSLLEPFPQFAEWRADYVDDYEATHMSVTVEEADFLAEAAQTEADNLFNSEKTEIVRMNAQSTETVPTAMMAASTAAASTTKAAKKKAAPPQSAPSTRGRRASEVPPSVINRSVEKIVGDDSMSKFKRARAIMMKFHARKNPAERKEVIGIFTDQLGLTTAGAATYYQKIKQSMN